MSVYELIIITLEGVIEDYLKHVEVRCIHRADGTLKVRAVLTKRFPTVKLFA